jgi:hypothetical protein
MDLDTIYPEKDRFGLAMMLNNVLASPSFENWRSGEPLDIERLMHTPTGKPRVSIIYIAHLSDAERMFFVTLLLERVISWMRKLSGTTSLRGLLYMDEIFGFFPPIANPPSKRPLLTLLKQARAFGLGVMLTTQNPVRSRLQGPGQRRHLVHRQIADRARQGPFDSKDGKRRVFGGGSDGSRLFGQVDIGAGFACVRLHNVHGAWAVALQDPFCHVRICAGL